MAQAQQGAVRPGDRPSVRVRLVGATAALAALLTLAACSPAASPDPEPTTTASTPSPTPSPEPTVEETAEPSPDTSPSPTDPNDRSELLVEPEEMQNVDEEGAIAAAKYFMGLFEYVYLTGDLEKWEEMSLDGCGFCQTVAESVRELHSADQHMVSGPPEWIGRPKVKEVVPRSRWVVTIRARTVAGQVYDAYGDLVRETTAGQAKSRLTMLHDGESWRALSVEVTGDR